MKNENWHIDAMWVSAFSSNEASNTTPGNRCEPANIYQSLEFHILSAFFLSPLSICVSLFSFSSIFFSSLAYLFAKPNTGTQHTHTHTRSAVSGWSGNALCLYAAFGVVFCWASYVSVSVQLLWGTWTRLTMFHNGIYIYLFRANACSRKLDKLRIHGVY